jgi:hypothetical protein
MADEQDSECDGFTAKKAFNQGACEYSYSPFSRTASPFRHGGADSGWAERATGVCYTYDDVIFLPGHIFFAAHEVRLFAALRPRRRHRPRARLSPPGARVQVALSTKITKNLTLRTPLVSSPMDTGERSRQGPLRARSLHCAAPPPLPTPSYRRVRARDRPPRLRRPPADLLELEGERRWQ